MLTTMLAASTFVAPAFAVASEAASPEEKPVDVVATTEAPKTTDTQDPIETEAAVEGADVEEIPAAPQPAVDSSVHAMEVPVSSETANINGQVVLTEVYEVGKDFDPSALIQESFIRGDMIYTFDKIVKSEATSIKTKDVSKVVEVQSESKDLSKNIDLFESTIPYEDEDGYKGELTFDPKSVSTDADGYKTAYSKVRETKTYNGLEFNDPTLVPQTVEKNGYQLSIADIQWSEDTLVQDGSVPATYTATVSYSKTLSSSVATGYTVTAEYRGQVEKTDDIDCTYTLTYIGAPVSVEPEEEESGSDSGAAKIVWPVLGGAAVVGAGVAAYANRDKLKKKFGKKDDLM